MIDITNVSKWYGSFKVLDACSARVEKGEVLVVCGPSGKSTLIKCINGLEPFQKGEIIVDGTSVSTAGKNLSKLRAKVGMVFQNFELFPHLLITENLSIAQVKVLGRNQSEATRYGLQYLDRVGLSEHARKFPGQLSGGQQQRVAIARALAMVDFTRFRRQISASSSKRLECQRAQSGDVSAEKYRMIRAIATVQLLGVSSNPGRFKLSFSDQFYALAGNIRSD